MITTNSRRQQWPHYVSPVLFPPFVQRQSKIKSIKFPAGKGGGRADCLLAHNERTRYNKFVAPCESEVSLLLGHTLRIACTLKRRNNAAYKFRGIAEALFDREFLRGTHFSSDKFYTSLDLVFIASMMNLRKLFLKEKEKEKIFEEAWRCKSSSTSTIESIVSREFLGGRSAKYRGIRGIRQNQTISIYTFYNSMQRRRVRSDTCFHSNKLGSPIIISIHCIALRALHKRTDYVFDRCVALDRLFSRASKTILTNRRPIAIFFFFFASILYPISPPFLNFMEIRWVTYDYFYGFMK